MKTIKRKQLMSEAEMQEIVAGEAPKHGSFLFRNNNGAVNYFDPATQTTRHVRFGLGNISEEMSDRLKSSDLIGGTTVTITPDMVGKQVCVLTAVEMKKPGWKRSPTDEREQAQDNFIKFLLSRGAFAGFAQSVDDFIRIITR